MCLYYYDPNSTGTDATIYAMKLPAGGQESGLVGGPEATYSNT